MGGTFGAVGVLAALRERETTGRGKLVTSALFESTAYLVAQHMAQFELTGEAPPPMSVKRPAWGIYDIFETADTDGTDARLFVGVVTDRQWEIFCREFGLPELAADARLRGNADRVRERAWLIPRLGEILKRFPRTGLAASSRPRGCRSRRSPGPGTCSRTRTSGPRAACSKRGSRTDARSMRPPFRSRSTAGACPSATTRPRSARARANCSRAWATAPGRSTRSRKSA
jgi:crotonobetainyl-CoA:carnitine CoA-transferase CaiB-like acyl-CoA transferase